MKNLLLAIALLAAPCTAQAGFINLAAGAPAPEVFSGYEALSGGTYEASGTVVTSEGTFSCDVTSPIYISYDEEGNVTARDYEWSHAYGEGCILTISVHWRLNANGSKTVTGIITYGDVGSSTDPGDCPTSTVLLN